MLKLQQTGPYLISWFLSHQIGPYDSDKYAKELSENGTRKDMPERESWIMSKLCDYDIIMCASSILFSVYCGQIMDIIIETCL